MRKPGDMRLHGPRKVGVVLTDAGGNPVVRQFTGDPGDVLDGSGNFSPAGSASGNWVPLALGSEPLEFVSDGAGQPIFVWYEP